MHTRNKMAGKMKLYVVKVSPCCRAVWLYCLRNKLPVDIVEVDLFAGDI